MIIIILDLEVWIKEGRIMQQFFKKPKASRKLVSADSAFSTSKKRSILMEEGMRRLFSRTFLGSKSRLP